MIPASTKISIATVSAGIAANTFTTGTTVNTNAKKKSAARRKKKNAVLIHGADCLMMTDYAAPI